MRHLFPSACTSSSCCARLWSKACFNISVLAGGMLVLAPVLAQTPQQIGEAVRAGERIQQEQQERQRQQFLEDARQRKESAPITLPETRKPSVLGNGECRDIKEVVLTGVTLLSSSLQAALLEPYLNRCLTASDIEQLLGDVVKAYIERGYIAVRPYIRAQDLSLGRLEILIVEGAVESILLQDGGKNSASLATAFPWVIGQTLNLRDIEQGLDQLNRLASNNATMEILPGSEPGGTVVNVINNPAFPVGGALTADNLGSESTGTDQLGATVNVDNLLGLNDFLSLTHKESFTSDPGMQKSNMDSVYYSVPLGYGLFSFSSNASNYATPVVLASGTRLRSSGDSSSNMARFDWVGYRDQLQKLTTSIGITQKTSKNYLSGQLLEVSSRNLSIMDLDLLWNRKMATGMISLGLGYSAGLDAFGALRDSSNQNLASTSPHAQGDKLRYSANLFMPFKVANLDASFFSQLSGQHAYTALYGSEQMLVGSYYTVRGFVKNILTGDRAHYVRNELALTVANGFSTNITIRPYLGLDFGRVEQFANTAAASLVGGAAGVRLSSRYFTGDVAVVKPLSAPQYMVKESSQVLATVSIVF
jgi:hemolysin activation/secretion protein